ncbi:MAG: hypothetical protein WA030_02860 [Candidatus Microsaccharimonas sp.]
MKARNRKQAQLLRELESNPLIERACKKVGIARSTYYRWCEADISFKEKSVIAQDKGRDKLNDFVESKLLENIGNNQQTAISYWLSHNTARYRHPTTQFQAYRMENMKHELWRRTDIVNTLIEILGWDRFLRLFDQSNYEDLLKEIDKAYETEQISKGFRGKHGYKPPDGERIPYPDDINFNP